MSTGTQVGPNIDPGIRIDSKVASDAATVGAADEPVVRGLSGVAGGLDLGDTVGAAPIDDAPTTVIAQNGNPQPEPVSVFGRWALNIENAATAGHESETRVSAWFERGRERIAGAKDRFKERFDPLRRTARESARLGKTILKYSPVLAVGAASIAVEKSVGGVSDVGRAIARGAKAVVGFVTGGLSTIPDRFSSRVDELSARGLQARANVSVLREAVSHSRADRVQERAVRLEEKRQSSAASASSAADKAKEALSFDAQSNTEQKNSLLRGIGHLVAAKYFSGRAKRQASRLEKKIAKVQKRGGVAEARSGITDDLIGRIVARVDSAHKNRARNPGIRVVVTHGIGRVAVGVVNVLDGAAAVYNPDGLRSGTADAIHNRLQSGDWWDLSGRTLQPAETPAPQASGDGSNPQD